MWRGIEVRCRHQFTHDDMIPIYMAAIGGKLGIISDLLGRGADIKK